MSVLEIFLIVFCAMLAGILIMIVGLVGYSHIESKKYCNGKPYDTMDTETWYAKCGKEAPHCSHRIEK